MTRATKMVAFLLTPEELTAFKTKLHEKGYRYQSEFFRECIRALQNETEKNDRIPA